MEYHKCVRCGCDTFNLLIDVDDEGFQNFWHPCSQCHFIDKGIFSPFKIEKENKKKDNKKGISGDILYVGVDKISKKKKWF